MGRGSADGGGCSSEGNRWRTARRQNSEVSAIVLEGDGEVGCIHRLEHAFWNEKLICGQVQHEINSDWKSSHVTGGDVCHNIRGHVLSMR